MYYGRQPSGYTAPAPQPLPAGKPATGGGGSSTAPYYPSSWYGQTPYYPASYGGYYSPYATGSTYGSWSAPSYWGR